MAQYVGQSVHVHRFGQTVAQGLLHQWDGRESAVGPLADHIVLAGNRVRKNRRQKIFRPHSLDLGRDLLALRETKQSNAREAFQRQRVANIGACKTA